MPVFNEETKVIFDYLEQTRKGKYESHIEIKGHFGIRNAGDPKAKVVKEKVQMPPVLDCVDNRSLFVQLLQGLNSAFVQTGALEEPIKNPAQKKTRFEIYNTRKGLFIFSTLFLHPVLLPLPCVYLP